VFPGASKQLGDSLAAKKMLFTPAAVLDTMRHAIYPPPLPAPSLPAIELTGRASLVWAGSTRSVKDDLFQQGVLT